MYTPERVLNDSLRYTSCVAVITLGTVDGQRKRRRRKFLEKIRFEDKLPHSHLYPQGLFLSIFFLLLHYCIKTFGGFVLENR